MQYLFTFYFYFKVLGVMFLLTVPWSTQSLWLMVDWFHPSNTWSVFTLYLTKLLHTKSTVLYFCQTIKKLWRTLTTDVINELPLKLPIIFHLNPLVMDMRTIYYLLLFELIADDVMKNEVLTSFIWESGDMYMWHESMLTL